MKICKKCNKSFPIWIKINDKIQNLQNRKYCIECSPYKKHNTRQLHDLKGFGNTFIKEGKKFRICPICEKELELNNNNFYITKSKNFHHYCKKCNHSLTVKRQQEIKRKCVDYKGGKCQNCGYNRYIGALEFHHLNPKEKDFNIGHNKCFQFEKLKSELNKCILLCSNCHREEHGKLKMVSPPEVESG